MKFSRIFRAARRRVAAPGARVFLCWIAIAGSARGGEFEVGNESYDAGQFASARNAYQRVIARGEWSANVFYNLANAEFRLGEKGLAALNYERALALEPSHPEAAANLRLVQEQSGAHLPEKLWFDALFPRVAADVIAVLGVAAATIALACAVAMLMRGASGILGTGLFVGVLVAGWSGVALWRDWRAETVAVIVAKQVEARLAPADRAGVAEALPAGSRVRVRSERGEWTYCELPGKGLGWLPAGTLEKIRISRR